jgi:SAM-dependent methyltransferase
MVLIIDNQCSCCDSYLEKTTVTHSLFNVIRKWEAHGVEISQDTWSDYPEDLELTLYHCKNCGFGVFLPMTVGSGAFYTDISRNEYYLSDRWDFHVAIKAMRSQKLHSVLDVGCGRGAFLNLVTKKLPNVECHGNDANPAVRNSLPHGVKLYENLSDAPSGLDAVTLFQVIEHVADPVELLRESIAKVRSGGLVIVSVPDHSGPIRFFADSHTAIPPHHVSIWTPQSLELLLSKLGLSIVGRKTEPLPDYLMPFYLPKILAHKLGVAGDLVREDMLTKRLSIPIINICRKLGIKSLPIHGHTYIIVAKNT